MRTQSNISIRRLLALIAMVGIVSGGLLGNASAAYAAGKVHLQVVDATTGKPIAVRMTLFRSNGKPAPIRGGTTALTGSLPGSGTARDGSTAIDGVVELKLPEDTYRFVISRGPEYHEVQGTIGISEGSERVETIRVPRIMSMLSEGWISGDVAADVTISDVDLRCRAEDLHVVGIATQTNPSATESIDSGTGKITPTTLPELARGDLLRGTGNASDLLLVGVDNRIQSALEHTSIPSTIAPSGDFIRLLSGSDENAFRGDDQPELSPARLVVLNPMAKDLPLWLATERVDGIAVLGEYLVLNTRTQTWPNSVAPKRLEMKGAHGLGLWSVFTYEQILECGLEIPPIGSAGSGFQKNPLGYSRSYVFSDEVLGGSTGERAEHRIDDEYSRLLGEQWWQGLWRGRSVVTNGPLLRPTLEGHPPGHRFYGTNGQILKLSLALQLAIRDPVDYLEVIQNGRIVYKARLDEFASQGGRIPPLEFDSSGWVMVRVMTKYADHYRAAMSAPWFVQFDGNRRVSGKAVEFFQDLLLQRERELANLPKNEIALHAPYVREARAFWAERAELVNAP